MFSVKKYVLILSLATVAFSSCKKWDDHVEVTDQALNKNLMDEIGQHAELAKFKEYLVKTGLDKIVSSSNNYSIWAPTDDALKALTTDVINDTAKLKAVLLNHISGQLFFTRNAVDSLRVPMLNGKRVFFYNKKFDDANITQADIYLRNGALHVIDKAILPLSNIWEYIAATTATYSQNAYVASLIYKIQDPAKAVLDSINPVTGNPVYKPNTGIVDINTYRTKVYDIANEDSLYTYILLTNTSFTAEVNKQKPYFNSTDAAITTGNSSWNVVKDLTIKGLYTPAQLPSVLLSKFNVHVNINKNTITESRKVSNGMVYILSDATSPITEKIPTFSVEGEFPVGFRSLDSKYTIATFYRQRLNTLTGKSFNDIYLNLGSSGANYFVDYRTENLYATKYKVYWVALNDKTASGQGDNTYGTDSTFTQMLNIGAYADTGTFAPSATLPKAVKPYDYTEVYIGDYTNAAYDWLLSAPAQKPDGSFYSFTPASRRLRLQAPATVTSSLIPFNLSLDYIKFVPY